MSLKIPKLKVKVPKIKLPKPRDLVPIVSPGAAIANRIAKGDSAAKAVRSVAADQAKVGKQVAAVAAAVAGQISAIRSELAGRIGGPRAQAFLKDLERITRPLDEQSRVAVLGGIEAFIRTGNIQSLNPFVLLIAQEIQRARDDNWSQASAIPSSVIARLPSEVAGFARTSRIIRVSQVAGRLNLPKFAIDHLRKATAVTTIDLIFFNTIPGATTNDDMHYWCHELWHVRQYATWGLEKFARQYVTAEIGFQAVGSDGNSVEVEADRFACKAFPVAHPHYIKRCP